MSRMIVLALVLAAAPAGAAKPTVAQLTAPERARYQELLGTPDSQELVESFLQTRGFLRDCQAVLDKRLPASKLPFKPDLFSDEFVSETEQKTIRTAQYLSIISAGSGLGGMKA